MAVSSSCITSSSWLIRLMSYLSHDNSSGMYEKLRPCPNPVIFGVQLSPTFEAILSMALPFLFGLSLGAYGYFVQNTSSSGKKVSSTLKWPLLTNAVSLIRSMKGRQQMSSKKTASYGKQESMSDDLQQEPPAQQEPPQRINVMKPGYQDTMRESGIHPSQLPQHIAVIMDGNRRYGKRVHGMQTRGHYDGGKKAIQFVEWCHTEGIPVVTLFAFSTENWNRSKVEVDFLMCLFEKFMRDINALAHNRKLRINHFFTEKDKLPANLLKAFDKICRETKDYKGQTVVNVCLNYGGRHEIVNASRSIAQRCLEGEMTPANITEDMFAQHLNTAGMPEPEIMIRTSGEYRISNFLLWQLAYAEFFFTKCDWPEIAKTDLLDILREFAKERERRFGR